MGHLLSTTNPEAAAAIGKEAAVEYENVGYAPPLPPVGDSVVFYPRPGELRAGRGRHFAAVTAQNEDGTLDLVVVYDADDFIGQRRVPRRNLDGGMGWEPIERKAAGHDPRVEVLAAEVATLNEELAALKKIVLGALKMPEGESVLGILDEYEDRLTVLEARKKPGPKPKAEG